MIDSARIRDPETGAAALLPRPRSDGDVSAPVGAARIDVVEPPETAAFTESRTVWSRLTMCGARPLLFALDLLAVLLGVLGPEVAEALTGSSGSPAKKTFAFGVILLGLFVVGGLYRSRLSLSVLDDLPSLAGRWLAAAAIAVLGQVLWSKAVWRDYMISWRFLWGALFIIVLVVLFRTMGYAAVRALRRRGVVAHRTLIVGTGRVGNQVAEILIAHPEYGLHPVAFVDADPSILDTSSGLPVLSARDGLGSLIRHLDVSQVVVAFCSQKESQMVGLIRTCDRHRCELFVVPRLFELHQVAHDMETVWGFPLVRLRRAAYRSPGWRIKRIIDVTVSSAALVIFAPVLCVVALAVRLDGGPGIIFRQERVGVDGLHFQLMKFRSLRPVDQTESATNWNIALDSRLSRLGRLLRKTSLDELPQFLNVLRGDMSLVGPRPERPYFVDQFRSAYPSYAARHRVPSGLTGWAQVHGLRGDTSIGDRARFDNYYIENWSLWLDVKIIVRTLSAVIRCAGA